MKTKKLLAISLAILVVIAMIVPIGVSAEDGTAAPVNVLSGLTAKVSTTDGWLLENRPVANLTDGTGTLSDKGESAAWANPTTLSAVGGYSYALFSLSSATDINKVVIQQRSEMSNSADIAVDVLLQSGGWKRVASEYGISDTYKESILTFSTVSVIAVKVSFGGNADIAELEAYNDTSLTEFGGVKLPENEEVVIPDADATMNLLRGIQATSSNTDGWFATNRPVSWLTDGTGTVFSIGWEAEYKAPASITPAGGTDIAYVSFVLPEAKNINRILIQQNTEFTKTTRFAVDVRIADGNWRQVASDYSPEFTFSGFEMTFEPVKAVEIRIIARTECLHINEIEAYYDPAVTEYSGIKVAENAVDTIPEACFINRLKGMTAATSNTDDWYNENRPAANITDGTGTCITPLPNTNWWDSRYTSAMTSLTSANGSNYAYVAFDFGKTVVLNEVIIQQPDHTQIDSATGDTLYPITKSFSVDVRLTDGSWKQVAASYSVDEEISTLKMTFEAESLTALRITARTATLHLTEIEAYYDPTITEYSGIAVPENPEDKMPEYNCNDITGDYAVNATDIAVLRELVLGIDNGYKLDGSGMTNDIISLVRLKKAAAELA